MFTKRNLVDIKKSTSKLQDLKKDLTTRIKHLKIILGSLFFFTRIPSIIRINYFSENVDSAEAKGLFEANFSHIYNILYESFVQTETNLRQRGRSFLQCDNFQSLVKCCKLLFLVLLWISTLTIAFCISVKEIKFLYLHIWEGDFFLIIN